MSGGAPPPAMRVVGLSHRTAPVEVREALTFAPEETLEFLAAGRDAGTWTEAMLLSTCNRTELYAASRDGDGTALVRRIAGVRPGVPLAHPGLVYEESGEGAVRRLLRVACGLESMVLGEHEIAGQVREAHRMAREAGTSGPVLERVVPAALRVSARVRGETAIARGASSVPAAAFALARRHFGEIRERRVLVVGAGEAGRIAARLVAAQRPAALWVTNRTGERAEEIAAELRAATWPFDDLAGALAEVDLVLCAARATEPVIRLEHLRASARRRAGRMLVLLDLGVPRNVDPRARDLEGVFLHDMDAVEALVGADRASRRAEVARVESMLEEHVRRIAGGADAAGVESLVAALRRRQEEVRAREVERSLRHFGPEQREHLDRLTRSLLDKVLHDPLHRLRSLPADDPEVTAARRLFGLDGGDGDDGAAPPAPAPEADDAPPSDGERR